MSEAPRRVRLIDVPLVGFRRSRWSTQVERTGTAKVGTTTTTTAAIAIDKQVSVDGSTWVDVGSGVLNDPSALVGGTVYYRAIVTNTGAVTETGITVTDVNGPAFTFPTTTLAAGASVTSSVSTVTAVSGHLLDTATVTGTASLGSTTQTQTAVDTADYTGVTAAIAIDKQVSVDGSTWVDVGSGVLNDPSALVGGTVYYRAIVTNTGQATETGITVTDVNGPGFTLTAAALAAGASETSSISTTTAVSGHVLDTATVTGTASLGSTTQTQTAVDTADYSGVTGPPTIAA
ncbi:MAG: hypothetical protein P4L86_12610, partial [Mycobacterium sp.]|nr:hypothetical protein [Mycobacterium sp.]